mgnify:FL=1
MVDFDVVELREVPLEALPEVMEDLLDLLDLEVVRYKAYDGFEYSVRKKKDD